MLDIVEQRRAVSQVAVFTFLKSIHANPYPGPVRERKRGREEGREEGREKERDVKYCIVYFLFLYLLISSTGSLCINKSYTSM